MGYANMGHVNRRSLSMDDTRLGAIGDPFRSNAFGICAEKAPVTDEGH